MTANNKQPENLIYMTNDKKYTTNNRTILFIIMIHTHNYLANLYKNIIHYMYVIFDNLVYLHIDILYHIINSYKLYLQFILI